MMSLSNHFLIKIIFIKIISKIISKILLIVTGLFVLSSCALAPIKTIPVNTYILNQDNLDSAHSQARAQLTSFKSSQILFLSPIKMSSWLDTSRMAYLISPMQINYFARHAWGAKPSELLQPLILHALENSHQYRAVIFAPITGHYDQRLDIKILDFQQVFLNNNTQSFYKITIQAVLINHHLKILAQKRFEFTEKTFAPNPQSGVIAANHLLKKFLPDLVLFIQHAK